MKRTSLLAALTAISLSGAHAAIDFTPVVREYTSQGFNYVQLAFKTDVGLILYNPPLNWTYRGSSDRLQLAPPDNPFAEAVIQAGPVAVPAALDEAALNSLEQQALQQVPPNSQSVEVVKREQNPVLLNESQSFEVVIAYQTLGYTFQRSVIFVLTPDTQLIFQFAAPKDRFDALHASFRRSITSWQWNETKPAAAAPTVASTILAATQNGTTALP